MFLVFKIVQLLQALIVQYKKKLYSSSFMESN